MVQPNSRELSVKCMEPCSNSGHVVTTYIQVHACTVQAVQEAVQAVQLQRELTFREVFFNVVPTFRHTT